MEFRVTREVGTLILEYTLRCYRIKTVKSKEKQKLYKHKLNCSVMMEPFYFLTFPVWCPLFLCRYKTTLSCYGAILSLNFANTMSVVLYRNYTGKKIKFSVDMEPFHLLTFPVCSLCQIHFNQHAQIDNFYDLG